MGAAAGAEQRRALSSDEPASSGTTAVGGKKRRWLGLRKSSAAGTKGATEEANDKEKELEEDGLQVDFYLVIVRSPLFQLDLASSSSDSSSQLLSTVPQVHRLVSRANSISLSAALR